MRVETIGKAHGRKPDPSPRKDPHAPDNTAAPRPPSPFLHEATVWHPHANPDGSVEIREGWDFPATVATVTPAARRGEARTIHASQEEVAALLAAAPEMAHVLAHVRSFLRNDGHLDVRDPEEAAQLIDLVLDKASRTRRQDW